MEKGADESDALRRATEEIARLQVELAAKLTELKASREDAADSRRTAQDAASKVQRLESQIARARLDEQEAEQKVGAKGQASALSLLHVAAGDNSAGGLAGALG